MILGNDPSPQLILDQLQKLPVSIGNNASGHEQTDRPFLADRHSRQLVVYASVQRD
ncbi:hypothetical protein D3C71_2243320 [compost metagenome]